MKGTNVFKASVSFAVMTIIIAIAIMFMNAIPFSQNEKAVIVGFVFLLVAIMFYFAFS